MHRHSRDKKTFYHCAPFSAFDYFSTVSCDIESISDLYAHLKSPQHLSLRPPYLQQRAKVLDAGVIQGAKAQKGKAVEIVKGIPLTADAGPCMSAAPSGPFNSPSLGLFLSAQQSAGSRPAVSGLSLWQKVQPASTCLSATPPIPTVLPFEASQNPPYRQSLANNGASSRPFTRSSRLRTIIQLGENFENAWEAFLAES
ncbi:hypothetical protein IAR50_004268 [Cryptococcus sp. DSM 104548]